MHMMEALKVMDDADGVVKTKGGMLNDFLRKTEDAAKYHPKWHGPSIYWQHVDEGRSVIHVYLDQKPYFGIWVSGGLTLLISEEEKQVVGFLIDIEDFAKSNGVKGKANIGETALLPFSAKIESGTYSVLWGHQREGKIRKVYDHLSVVFDKEDSLCGAVIHNIEEMREIGEEPKWPIAEPTYEDYPL